MTTREMVMNLMAECMEDAARVVAPYLPTRIAPQTLAVVAGEMAAEMFRARWERGSTRLVSAIHHHPFRDDGRGDCAKCGEGVAVHGEEVER